MSVCVSVCVSVCEGVEMDLIDHYWVAMENEGEGGEVKRAGDKARRSKYVSILHITVTTQRVRCTKSEAARLHSQIILDC